MMFATYVDIEEQRRDEGQRYAVFLAHHTGDLVWERRHDGEHVEYRIRELSLKSCRYAWRLWRWQYTGKRQIVDTEILRAHGVRVKSLYDEALARVVARYTMMHTIASP